MKNFKIMKKTFMLKFKVVISAVGIYVWLLFTFLLTSCTSDFIITSDNKVLIVIPVEATVTEKFAAEELSRYLKQITKNEKISVRSEDVENNQSEKYIFIGNTGNGKMSVRKIAGKDSESFIISVNSKNLVINGNCDRATLYAAYTFLEQIGCRWLAPGIDYVPERNKIEIKNDFQIHEPGIKLRATGYFKISEPSEWTTQCVDWAV